MLESNQVHRGDGRQSYRSLFFIALGYRNFRFFWLSNLTEHIGEYMEVAAILWLVWEMTHSPLMLTIVGSSRYMVMIFLPLIGGVVADRVNRRNLLIVSLLGSAVLSIALLALSLTGLITVWHLIVISLLTGTMTSFNHPARQSILPNLIKKEHLLNAVSLHSVSNLASRMIGMVIAGYLIAILGVTPIFGIRALGLLLAIFWLALIKVPPTPSAARERTLWHNLTEGFNYLRGNTIILIMLALYLVPVLAINTSTNFMPVFAQDILHIGAVGYGYFQGASGLGAALGLIGLAMLTYYTGKVKLLFGAGVILGISLLGFSASSWVSLSLPLLVLGGGMQAGFMALNTALIQNSVPDALRGRVMSWRDVAFGLGTVTSILFGAIARYTGVPFSLGLLGGIVLFVFFLLILLLPKFRSLG